MNDQPEEDHQPEEEEQQREEQNSEMSFDKEKFVQELNEESAVIKKHEIQEPSLKQQQTEKKPKKIKQKSILNYLDKDNSRSSVRFKNTGNSSKNDIFETIKNVNDVDLDDLETIKRKRSLIIIIR